MKTLAATLLSLGLILFSSNANAWFFFILPGSVTSKIGDALTGSEGENCVGPDAKVGDQTTFNGVAMTIKSLSGNSSRCTDAVRPIRALLVPSTVATPAPSTLSSPTLVQEDTTEAKIQLPLGWEILPIKDTMKGKGIVLYALNKTLDAGLFLTTIKRSGIADITTFVETRRTTQEANLREPKSSEISRLLTNGLNAWQFSTSGKLTNGMRLTYLQTIYDGETEVVILNIWTLEGSFERQKDNFIKIAESLTGLRQRAHTAKDADATSRSKDDESKKFATGSETTKAMGAETKRVNAESDTKSTPALAPQIDFNAEAIKASRILGCTALEAKVIGIDKENILYSIACSDSRALQLSCDPAGLCLQKK